MNMHTATLAGARPMSVLAETAMLARPTITQWSTRRGDKRATDAVLRENGAAPDAGRFNKSLIDPKAMGDVTAAATAARTYHYSVTLPWTDEGARILPAPLFMSYSRRMQDLRIQFEQAAAAFCADYPYLIQSARARLGDLFSETDYPSPQEIRRKFSFDLAVSPIPSGADFRLDVPDAIRADVERRAQEALSLALGDVGQRIADAVGHMAERLAAYQPGTPGNRAEGTFRSSLVDNVRELAALIPAFNLNNDPHLARIGERISAQLCEHDAEELRNDEDLRDRIADAAKSILQDVNDFLA